MYLVLHYAQIFFVKLKLPVVLILDRLAQFVAHQTKRSSPSMYCSLADTWQPSCFCSAWQVINLKFSKPLSGFNMWLVGCIWLDDPQVVQISLKIKLLGVHDQ